MRAFATSSPGRRASVCLAASPVLPPFPAAARSGETADASPSVASAPIAATHTTSSASSSAFRTAGSAALSPRPARTAINAALVAAGSAGSLAANAFVASTPGIWPMKRYAASLSFASLSLRRSRTSGTAFSFSAMTRPWKAASLTMGSW